MSQLARNFRRLAAIVLMLTATASFTAAQGVDPSGKTRGNPEQAKRNLTTLADALSKLHPDSRGLAARVAKLKVQLAALTPEQLSEVSPVLSEPEFMAAVDRLAIDAAPDVQVNAAPIDVARTESAPWSRVRLLRQHALGHRRGPRLVIASDALALAAIGGDVVCNTVVTIIGEGTNLPGCIAAGVLHVASQAVQFELDLRSYCDSVIDSNEIRGILNNSTVIGANLAAHDTDIKAALATHDADIKALLAILQKSVDEANQRLKVSEALERQTILLLLTPEGQRNADPAVLDLYRRQLPQARGLPWAPVLVPDQEVGLTPERDLRLTRGRGAQSAEHLCHSTFCGDDLGGDSRWLGRLRRAVS